jgi:hypothetical protein
MRISSLMVGEERNVFGKLRSLILLPMLPI